MSSFVAFAHAHGVLIDQSKMYASQRIHRCPTSDHPRSKNGAFFWDGERGWCFRWDAEARVQWWNDPNARPWTDAEKEQWRRQRDSARSAQQRGYAQAAQRAQALLDTANPDVHDYLHLKGFPELRAPVLQDGALVVPMRNVVTNRLQGLQLIRWDADARKWVKKMTYGMQARNAVFRMGPQKAQESIFCEGYATGLSLEAAARQLRLHAAVVVCFSAGNIKPSADQVQGRKYVYADNDASGAGERAAIDAGLPYCMSDTVGFDANDEHQKHGLMAVCKKLMDLRRRRDL